MINRTLILFLTVVAVTGCQSTKTFQSSSVVDFLYSNEQNPMVSSEIPRLPLPLKVGIAFTPTIHGGGPALTEKSKYELMMNIGDHFRSLDFVKSIEIIPSGYLKPRGGFDNLSQLKRMFDVDVIALISYDQTIFTDEGLASIAYWTIIGAYIIPGEKNSTHTMMDLVLYDVDSRKMLLRAPGTSASKSYATPINLREQTRHDSLAGFTEASEDLVVNLNVQLELFREKVKKSPEQFQIVHRKSYRGSGSTPWLLVVGAFGIFLRRYTSNG